MSLNCASPVLLSAEFCDAMQKNYRTAVELPTGKEPEHPANICKPVLEGRAIQAERIKHLMGFTGTLNDF